MGRWAAAGWDWGSHCDHRGWRDFPNHLDDRHSVFGRVVEGMDVLNSIRERDPGRDPSPGDRIDTIEIEER